MRLAFLLSAKVDITAQLPFMHKPFPLFHIESRCIFRRCCIGTTADSSALSFAGIVCFPFIASISTFRPLQSAPTMSGSDSDLSELGPEYDDGDEVMQPSSEEEELEEDQGMMSDGDDGGKAGIHFAINMIRHD